MGGSWWTVAGGAVAGGAVAGGAVADGLVVECVAADVTSVCTPENQRFY